MQVTKEYLAEVRKTLEGQEQNHLALAQQARGAITTVDHLFGFLEKPEPAAETPQDATTLQNFAEQVAGRGATAEILPFNNPGAAS